jgi:hypothetical protein
MLAVIVGACGDTTGPQGATAVSLSVTAPTSAPAAAPAGPSRVVTQSDGQNELVIHRVAVVLRAVELKRAVSDDCDSPGGDDSCEEFQTGPMVLEIPTDGSTVHVVAIDVPADTYDQIEFDIHKPDDDSPEDQAFLQANPDFVDTSVRVEGTWNGQAFLFEQDLNEEQELDLSPALVIGESAEPTNLTLEVDVTTWFTRSDGSLIDPESANKGEVNEGLVELNIRNSIEAFEDPDEDGKRD